jgi:hypothetical protein
VTMIAEITAAAAAVTGRPRVSKTTGFHVS